VTLTTINQQYKDVKEKLSDLVPWVEKVSVTLMKADPGVDAEEAERRSQLVRFVPSVSASRLYKTNPLRQILGGHWGTSGYVVGEGNGCKNPR
jgi:hypothetical protein